MTLQKQMDELRKFVVRELAAIVAMQIMQLLVFIWMLVKAGK